MQQAVYRTWLPPSASASQLPENKVHKLVSENALVVFGNPGCCMCHVAKQLLLGLGVNPMVEEVDATEEGKVIEELSIIAGFSDEKVLLPAFFVGGKYFGGLERIMATHITGELVPILRNAGALWL